MNIKYASYTHTYIIWKNIYDKYDMIISVIYILK